MIRNWWRRRLVVGTLRIAVGAASMAGSASAADSVAADELMLRLMSKYDVPGVALALIKDGGVVLERGYGFRDLAASAPVTTATLFNIGSISKSFTALGVAQLVDHQQADLDAPVVRYIPDLRLSDPRIADGMTLRQLLSHASGFPPDRQWPPQVPSTRGGVVDEFASMPISAPPRTRFQYCSRCVVLAAYALERITGQSWEAYTRTQIFEPLGMTRASFGALALEQATDRAQPYRHDAIAGQIPIPWGRLQYLEPLAPAGGIDADIEDMARYALLQLGDGTLSGHQVVSAQMLAELHRPEMAVGTDWTPAAVTENLHHALGWFTANVRGLHIVYHNGANPGFRAAIVLVPASKTGVVILTNGESDAFTSAATRGLIEQLVQ